MKNHLFPLLPALLALTLSACAPKASPAVTTAAPQESTPAEPALFQEETGVLCCTPSQLLVRSAQDADCENDFFYFLTYGQGLKECDLLSGEVASIKGLGSGAWSIRAHGGYVYHVSPDDTSRVDFNSLIMRTDLNTGESEELYRPAEAGAYIKMLSFTREGELLFIQGNIDSDTLDENGCTLGQALCSLDMGTGEARELVKAGSYYIAGDTLLFTRREMSTGAQVLYTASWPGLDDPRCTGIRVCPEDDGVVPYMYTVIDGRVWYSADNELLAWDPGPGETEVICTFPEDTYVREFYPFSGRITVLLRENSPQGWQFGLYYLEDGEPVKVLDDGDLNAGREYCFEHIEYVSKFEEFEDTEDGPEQLIMSTFNTDIDRRVYMIDENFHYRQLLSAGEWDYDAFLEQRQAIETEVW